MLAQESGMRLVAPPIAGFPRTSDSVVGQSAPTLFPPKKVNGHLLPNRLTWRGLHLEGYFQRFEYLDRGQGLDQVKDWCRPESQGTKPPPKNHLVVSIRRGWNGWPVDLCPPASFYIDAIRNLGAGEATITTDSPDDPWFDSLRSSGLSIDFFRGSALSQFEFLTLADRILMAPSTFTWWAAFVGRGTTVYWPEIEGLAPQSKGMNWFPLGDNRYTTI